MEAGKKQAEDLAKAADQVFKQTRSPLEKYEERIGELSDLLNAGALDWDTYGRAVRAAREQLEQASKAADDSRPNATLAGTAEALAAAYDRARNATVTRVTQTDLAIASLGLPDLSPPAPVVIAAPQLATPPTPAPAAPVAQGMSEGLRELKRERDRQVLAEAKKQTSSLEDIERHTRDMAEGRAVTAGSLTLNVVEIA